MNEINRGNYKNIDWNLSISENINTFFKSEKFKKFILEVNEWKRELIIGVFIELKIICPAISNDDLIEEFIYFDSKWYFGNARKIEDFSLLIKVLIEKQLKLDKLDSIVSKSKVYNYFIDRYYENWFAYHWFNWAFEDSIIQNWLTGDIRVWNNADIDKIIEIIKRHNYWTVDFFSRSFLNCSWKFFYTDRWFPETYYYSVSSPEWFATFTGWINCSNLEERPFNSRNYELSKQNVIELCDTKNRITAEEKRCILDFFEKYWRIFASPKATPKLALIKKKALNIKNPCTDFNDYSKNRAKDSVIENVEKAIYRAIYIREEINWRYEGVIDTKNIRIIDLPNFNTIFPKKQSIELETKNSLIDNLNT